MIILVNFTQSLMFREVANLAEKNFTEVTAHDREEIRSAQVMLGVSIIYLGFAYFFAKVFADCYHHGAFITNNGYPDCTFDQ